MFDLIASDLREIKGGKRMDIITESWLKKKVAVVGW